MKPIYDFKPHTPRLDREFADYLEGKSVAIVGRSGIHDLEQGEFIDSHDVVVRVHWAVPYHPNEEAPIDNTKAAYNNPVEVGQFVPEEWHSRIGKRVNILYHRIRRDDEVYMHRWLEIFHRAGGRFFCSDSTASQDAFGEAFPQRYVEIRYVSWELKSDITLKICEKPDAGLVCIADILSYQVKEAYITGFLCFFDREIDSRLPHTGARPRLKALRFLCDLDHDERVTYDGPMQQLFDRHCR